MLRQSPKKDGPVFNVGYFRKAWISACIKAGLGHWEDSGGGRRTYVGLIVHDLRRSAVRNLREAGAGERTVMRVNRHHTPALVVPFDNPPPLDVTPGEKRGRTSPHEVAGAERSNS